MRGLICIWTGTIANVPLGWAWCDGNNGTPDLRERFVICAGDLYAVDEVGGSLYHTHDFTGDGHRHFAQEGEDIDSGFGKTTVSAFTPATGTTEEQPDSDFLRRHYVAFIMKL